MSRETHVRFCEQPKGKILRLTLLMIKVPPKYAVAEVIGYIKGKSAIAVARQFGGRKKNFNGERFWARGYAVSTVGFEEAHIRKYIENQVQLDGVGEAEKGEF